ncbi:MAG: GNAT family N-acetyltransferase [Oscillospiraceae bacterium]|jgi:predicted N-acetyltransferase YhbS|nr:GNAT family N-acetyltransferase [Oscillospiraceae bacterium]
MIEIRALRPEELPAWYAHCQGVFTGEREGYFRDHFEMDPDADPSLIFVAMEGDAIAATLRVFRRRMWLSGRAIPIGGIGEVSTKPAYRRQGLSTALLQQAIAAMEARDMPVSMLMGNQNIYLKTGWRFCPERYALLHTDPLPPLPEGAVVRPFAPDDLPLVMGLYDLYTGRMNGALLRSEAYWRRWVLPQWHAPHVLEMAGRLAAYCCEMPNSRAPARYTASDCAAAPDAEALLPAMLGAVARSLGRERVLVPRPLLPQRLGKTQTARDDLMLRLNRPLEGIPDIDALIEAMRPSAGVCRVDGF